MSQVLKCKDCGKDFIKLGNKGTPPSRCPDCRLEAKREAARRCAEKRKKLRDRVREKQLNSAYAPGFRTCAKCQEKKPSELFRVDNKLRAYCRECRETSAYRPHGMHVCEQCRKEKPASSYELTRTGRNRRRICNDCAAEKVRAKERELQAQAETEAFIKELAWRRHCHKRSKQASAEAEKRMDALVLAAEGAGMSYGKYQAMLRQKKLQEDRGRGHA